MPVKLSDNTKPRRYNNSARAESARRTRQLIVDAGRHLFVENGYGATTMLQIAERAGVALDTVYATVGTKPLLFRHLLEIAISGADEPVDPDQRDYVRDIRAEPDARRKLARYAQASREIHARLAPLVRNLRDASKQEPELAELWEEISQRRARNMRVFVEDVAAAGELRPGLTIEIAADIVWSMHSPEFYLLLVDERGWTPHDWELWIADATAKLILS